MEEILLRFPHIGHHIFKELNDEDFFKSMKVNQLWKYFISGDFKAHKDLKKRVQGKIQSLTEEIDGNDVLRKFRGATPFHLAAARGYLSVHQQMVEKANDKNLKDNNGVTPLHGAAQ